MAEHYIEITGVILLFVFGMTMLYQGHLILLQKNGYSHRNQKIESANMRKRIETLLKDK
jgi:ABC-type nickel/cobalt efflux system permease component RcnA